MANLLIESDDPEIIAAVQAEAKIHGAFTAAAQDVLERQLRIECSSDVVIDALRNFAEKLGAQVLEYTAELIPPTKENLE